MLLKRLTFRVTCALLFAIPPGSEQDLLFEDFTTALRGLWTLPFNLPMTPFRRAIRACERICNRFSDLIRKRRKEILEGRVSSKDDVISPFVNLRDENGEEIREDVLIDNLITLMIGSHDTTAVLMGLLLRLIVRNHVVRNNIIEDWLPCHNLCDKFILR
ncbi:Taxane 10-beta-hydroxylase [Acorus gramineus]|uniref:Taxane 10-beta-hydroxylase n=1 Tax=Acorus gramineus TaxID=55184 RepID=A0AAV9B4K3_ACOGR|nr:Taxane 10-beta-hydroxylase [Acorus gramineus]